MEIEKPDRCTETGFSSLKSPRLNLLLFLSFLQNNEWRRRPRINIKQERNQMALLMADTRILTPLATNDLANPVAPESFERLLESDYPPRSRLV